jgi:hypothetical protein
MSDENPKRRWYQFSLKTLLIVMTLFVVFLGIAFLIGGEIMDFLYLVDSVIFPIDK